MRNYMTWVVGAVIIVAAIVGVVIATNNNKDKTSSTNTTPTSSPTPASSSSTDSSTSKSPQVADKVTIRSSSFSPAHIKVKKGTTVTWTNSDSITHTVTGDSSGGPTGQNLMPGQTYSFTFNQTGTFGYHCNIHQDMHGTVEVTD